MSWRCRWRVLCVRGRVLLQARAPTGRRRTSSQLASGYRLSSPQAPRALPLPCRPAQLTLMHHIFVSLNHSQPGLSPLSEQRSLCCSQAESGSATLQALAEASCSVPGVQRLEAPYLSAASAAAASTGPGRVSTGCSTCSAAAASPSSPTGLLLLLPAPLRGTALLLLALLLGLLLLLQSQTSASSASCAPCAWPLQ